MSLQEANFARITAGDEQLMHHHAHHEFGGAGTAGQSQPFETGQGAPGDPTAFGQDGAALADPS